MNNYQQPAHTLRLILGDQLNSQHSWFAHQHDDVLYVMMEVRQETDYVLHHAQKIIAIFAGMREFARRLQLAGHRVHYLTIDDPDNLHAIPANIEKLAQMVQAQEFQYQAPDEYRLDRQLQAFVQTTALRCYMFDSEHFLTQREEAGTIFEGRKKWLMEHFYRQMRVKYQVLMTGQDPTGGAWNFDHDNRKAWPGLPWEPEDFRPRHDHSALWATIQNAGVKSFGEPNASAFAWPLHRDEALTQLQAFVRLALPHFGDFQDAMSSKAWRLFHSLLSFALNVKMLSPREVIAAVEAAYSRGEVSIAAAEGYIRQILGWREYVRGVYWHFMPDYAQENVFDHQAELPTWFWTGKTKMRCLSHAIGQSLQQAHAHHIQRLMVIGNFSLLAGLHPQRVHEWYLGVYIDAFEWVELPNTLGMSQYADGGVLATKPYVSSAAYIDRMSNYCKGCHYDKKQRTTENACPFNALYWDFFSRNEKQLASNPRIGMVYPQLRKMSAEARQDLNERAIVLRQNLDAL
ncbi:cryptochrome/photolyase family protein [Undibacterium macrobrachii]|uniref:Cryptochrome/photolyase family protein n=1 Tax=Undibacterium macrobrachii TaxID=1119058 RepID=A0ABQ2XIC5_9BURK|nr:cryptochrome/photolyase family protein [Undibacterium macrobrachii]GGX18492.1 cryptochrome/photolyase family protein [Undibacterium macrobrachii]